MHAFIVVGSNKKALDSKIDEIAKDNNATVLEYSIQKIDDVRNLNSLIRLSLTKPTLIVAKNVHEASEEALNAFLKNLEEPQENAYFALTTNSVKKVLPTIVSRCEIIKTQTGDSSISEQDQIEMTHFFGLAKTDMLGYIDKIKDRGVGIKFSENMVLFMHGTIQKNDIKCKFSVEDVRLALKTLSGLKANGNVNLQLSNFVVNYK